MSLAQALKPSVTFTFENTDTSNDKMLAIIPGHYDCGQIINTGTDEAPVYKVQNSSATNIVAAGITCDQVADDYMASDTAAKVKVTANGSYKFRDFLNYVKTVGCKLNKITIKNLLSSDDSIFNQQILVSKSQVSGRSGEDQIDLQSYVSADKYDRSKIEIDMENSPMILDAETFIKLNIPKSAKFSIQLHIADNN